MSTRSDIIVHRADGKWVRVYCHWDGYLSHNGQILFDCYSSQERAEELVSHGDISSLAPSCDKPEGHSFSKPVKGYTVYYGRDRGEAGCNGQIGNSRNEVWPERDTWTEYTYIWDNGKWQVANPQDDSTRVDLSIALQVELV